MPRLKESPPPEPSPEKIQVLNLLELTPEQEKELRERIARYDHSLILMVHPLYDEYHPRIRDFVNKIPRVKKGLKLILQNIDHLPPLIIPEEYDRQKSTKDRLRKQLTGMSEKATTVYTLPTFPISPEPRIHNAVKLYGEPGDPGYRYRDKLREQWIENWESFRQVLTRLGVKKIYIGGMQFLSVEHPATNGCVGGYILNLEKEFQIELLPFTSPEGTPEIRRNKSSIYQTHLRPIPSKRTPREPKSPRS